MKKLFGVLLALLIFLVCSVPPAAHAEDLIAAAHAEDFSAARQEILKNTGIPVYPGASYTTGDDDVATMMWFKSMDSPKKIMDWYKRNLSGWLEMTVNGSRVLYKGPGKIEAKDLNNRPYLWARTTSENIALKDSQITIRIPK
ncbi:MAG: hypothetical protein GXP52_05595 [Deltaproteobacteria bacterium]|nr:hypothetical protein [Deltaproteobacteria bacterium]